MHQCARKISRCSWSLNIQHIYIIFQDMGKIEILKMREKRNKNSKKNNNFFLNVCNRINVINYL